MRTILFCIAALLTPACAASKVPFTSYAAGPAVAPAQVSDRELYEATLRVFADHGLRLAENDGTGLVVTEPRVVRNGSPRTLHAWRATVVEGSLQLSIDCFVVTSAGQEECEGTQRAVPWQKQAPELRAAIFAEAERLADDGMPTASR
jgi:hypothetical protein